MPLLKNGNVLYADVTVVRVSCHQLLRHVKDWAGGIDVSDVARRKVPSKAHTLLAPTFPFGNI